MASNMDSSINRRCHFIFYCSSSTCQENGSNREAEFYCEECSKTKFFCGICVELHNALFKEHAMFGKENISQWPGPDVVELEQCKEHRKEKLTKFCEDHSQLICQVCHVHNHQKCSHVVLIADKVKDLHQKGDLKELSASFDTQYQQLIHKKDDLEENIKSLEKSHKKMLEKINALRKRINDSLDHLEKNTKKELDTFLINMRTSIQTDIKQCSECMKNIACLKDEWLGRKDNSEVQSLIKYRRCLDQSHKVEDVMQEMTKKNEMALTFKPDKSIQQTLSTLSGLGQILSTAKQLQLAKSGEQNTDRQDKPEASNQYDTGHQTTPGFKVNKSYPESSSSKQYNPGNQTSEPTKTSQVSDPESRASEQLVQEYQPSAVSRPDQIIKVKSSKKYNVKIESDKGCIINGICETGSGELLVTDMESSKVKLLDHTYKVVDHLDLPGQPRSMSRIDDSLVAVTLDNMEVHFIRMSNRQLIKDRILNLQHDVNGIAHHHGNLYITDGRALYLYTIEGRLVSKMYEPKSVWKTVTSCAVSPDGDRIYVADEARELLVTLSRDGTEISNLIVIGINSSVTQPCLHVTESGQVLVCGTMSHKIYQVDRDGRQRLAEVVTQKDAVTNPRSVYFRKHTGSLIVGMAKSEDIIVFNLQ